MYKCLKCAKCTSVCDMCMYSHAPKNVTILFNLKDTGKRGSLVLSMVPREIYT